VSEAEELEQRQAQQRLERWSTLPPRVNPDEMTTEAPSSPPNPPEIGDPDRNFMLRYA
jgi:hypothetical protein